MSAPRPADFDAYWDRLDEELRRFDPAPELEETPLRSTPFSTSFDVRLTSVGPYRIFGFLSIPHGEGPFPAVLNLPRYGSVNNPPRYDDRERYVVLTLMHRGQRLADQPFAAEYPGLLTLGIDSPATYIYKQIIADCLRGSEFLFNRPEVDRSRIGLVGDDLAVLVAGRRQGFQAVSVSGTFFYRMMEARERTSAYPLEEINDYLRAYLDREEAVAETLAYFDPINHAPNVYGQVLLTEQDEGGVGGPSWLDPLAAAFGADVRRYGLTHEGGTDNDYLDAWMAEQLQVETRPRLWEEAR
jgi:cephalosporin-C deacetylase